MVELGVLASCLLSTAIPLGGNFADDQGKSGSAKPLGLSQPITNLTGLLNAEDAALIFALFAPQCPTRKRGAR